MALQISTTLDKGIVAPECYTKIITTDYVKISDLDQNLPGPSVIIAFYFNDAARIASPTDYIEAREYIFPNFSYETRAQQYTYLKTLPDFVGAIDV